MPNTISSQSIQQTAVNAVNSSLSATAFDIENVTGDLPQPVLSLQIDAMDETPAGRTSLGGVSECMLTLGAAACGAVAGGAYGALGGAMTGLIGGAVLDSLDASEQFQGLGTVAAEQGAVGNSVIFGAVGLMAGAVFGAASSLGDGESSVGGCGITGTLFMSLVGNALGNVILANADQDHTSQLQGAAATATGIATLTVSVLALAVCVICTGAVTAAAAS